MMLSLLALFGSLGTGEQVTIRYPGLAQRDDTPHYDIEASRPPGGRKR